jgi:predicted DNA-binding protein
MSEGAAAMTTTVRLPFRVEQALAMYCVEAKRTKSEVIVELLEQRFTGSTTERTPYELAQEAGFIGCVASSSAGKSAGKATAGSTKERVAAAIRKKHGKKSVA